MLEKFKIFELEGNATNYAIGNNGTVLNIKTDKQMKLFLSNMYKCVNVHYGNNRKRLYVHRMVALMHVNGYREGLVVNHKDGNKLNNSWLNLEWVTIKYNTQHAIMSGLKPTGEKVSKYSEETVHAICSMIESGVPNKRIQIATGVSKSIVTNIKNYLSWRHISINYNFNIKSKRDSKFHMFRNDIEKLIIDGYSNREIIKIVSLDNTDQVKNYIRDRRRYLKQNNVQRLSLGSEMSNRSTTVSDDGG